MTVQVRFAEIGVCGLSCRLCPRYHTEGTSRCLGCKTESRMSAGCPFITCALKKKNVEFCWECEQSDNCAKWGSHRKASRTIDSFKCYQTLESDIIFIKKNSIVNFDKLQKTREVFLKEMLRDFNDGQSKNYYSVAATVLEIKELEDALIEAKKISKRLDAKGRSKNLHAILDEIAQRKNYTLKLRKQK
jgi:hypothetical protein